MTPGSLVVCVDDEKTSIDMVGGESWSIPVGPISLVDGELEHADRPTPAQLTNAIGIASDHLDDVIRAAPMVLDAPLVTVAGRHALVLARVELGLDDVPDDYVLQRADADEVFRTLVAEPIAERVHNPGLPADDVETVIGTCCVVLAAMRRLELTSVAVTATAPTSERD